MGGTNNPMYWRPQATGNTIIDEFHKQSLDYVYSLQQTISNMQAQIASILTSSSNNSSSSSTTASSNRVSLQASASAQLTLTTSFQDIPGVTITLPASGSYLIVGVIRWTTNGAADLGAAFFGQLLFGGAAQTNQIIFVPASSSEQTFGTQLWLVSASAGQVVKLQAKKNAGTAASLVDFYTNITAVPVYQ